MKKHIVALIMVLALFAAVIPMQAMAASYPTVQIQASASTPTIQKGTNGKLTLEIDPAYYSESCEIVFVDSDGHNVGQNSYPLTNPSLKENKTITVVIGAGSMELEEGSYTANVWMEYYDRDDNSWYRSGQATQKFSFEVISDKCGSGHTLKKTDTIKAATCTETGLAEYTCTVCDHIVYEEIAKKDHKYALDYFIVTPSQTNAGEGVFGCKTCDDEKIEVIPISAVAKITTEPKSVTVSAGETATFTVKATGKSLKYQWYYRNAGTTTWKEASSTKATYSTVSKVERDGREFYCMVTDAYGLTDNSKVVKMKLPVVKITTQPKNASAYENEKATISVKATGDGLKYQWYYRTSSTGAWKAAKGTSASYSLTMTEARDGREMYCKVTDEYGNVKDSDIVKLTTKYKAKIVTQPTSAKAFDGEKATTTIKATGDGLKYQWYYKNSGSSSYKKSSITTAKCAVTMNEDRDGRKMYCVVTDKYGNSVKSNTVTLSMKKTVEITSQPKSQTRAVGERASFKVVATGDGLKYQWQYKNADSSTWKNASSTSASYSPTVKAAHDGRKFRCVVTDAYGNKENTKTVTLTLD